MTEPAGGAPRAVMFVDLAGYSALTEAHGDTDAADVAGRLRDITQSVCVTEARLVKTIGDAVMLVADSAAHAIETAVAILDAIEREPMFPAVRIGINAGPVVERDGDVFGSAVNLAARVAAVATPGQILCTAKVAEATGGPGVHIEPAGEMRAKNIPGSIRLFAIQSVGARAQSGEVDPVCRMRLSPADVLARRIFEGAGYVFCSETCSALFEEDPAGYLSPR